MTLSNHTSLESLFHLVHALKQQMHKQIEALDLSITTMHVRAIGIIAEQSPCTASNVANFLKRDKAQVTRLMNTLIEQGFIAKEANPQNKRSQCLCITNEAKTLLKQIQTIEKNVLAKMSTDISIETLEEFQQVTKQLTRNLLS